MHLADHNVWHGESISVFNFLCPPFQGLANVTRLREPDNIIEVWRLSVEASNIADVLACKVDKLLTFFSTEPSDLFREITRYMMMMI